MPQVRIKEKVFEMHKRRRHKGGLGKKGIDKNEIDSKVHSSQVQIVYTHFVSLFCPPFSGDIGTKDDLLTSSHGATCCFASTTVSFLRMATPLRSVPVSFYFTALCVFGAEFGLGHPQIEIVFCVPC